jgi:hypothetical protein
VDADLRGRELTVPEVKRFLRPGPPYNGQICLAHYTTFAEAWRVRRLENREMYRTIFDGILLRLGDSDDLSIAVNDPTCQWFFDPYDPQVDAMRKDVVKRARVHDVISISSDSSDSPRARSPTAGLNRAAPTMIFNVEDFYWTTTDGVPLLRLMELEMEMYAHHYQAVAELNGFLPVYHSLSQQLLRQNVLVHRQHYEKSGNRVIDMVAVPTPLRIRGMGHQERAFFLGLTPELRKAEGGAPPLTHDEVFLVGGGTMELKHFVYPVEEIKKWVSEESVLPSYLPIDDEGTVYRYNARKWTREHDLTTTLTEGLGVVFEDARILRWSDGAPGLQMVASSGYVPLDSTGRRLVNGMSLSDVRSWNIDGVPPDIDLYDGCLGVQRPAFSDPLNVPLTGLGDLSDALIGRLPWKTKGRPAFTKMWDPEDDRTLVLWKRTAARAFWEA